MNYLLTKRSLFITLLITLLVCTQTQAQQTSHKIILDQMNYLLYLPDGYEADTTKQWPMMVFLHGVGECGDEVEKVKLLGPPRKIADGHKYPFIVVSPQSPERGWKPDFIQKLVIDLQKKYRIDEDRTYLTGLSMGGFGTWRTAQSYPELFAAIIPICGGGDSYNVWSLENMPIWCFHGAKDDSVEISYSQTMIDSLKPYNNPNVKFTIYPKAGHDSWTETYNNEEVYKWMLSQKRFKYKEKPITPEALSEYTGTYANEGNPFQIIAEDNGLKIVWNEKAFSPIYKFTGNNKFIVTPDKFDYIKFDKDENNVITGFTMFYSRFKMSYKKQ
ncbi:MAG: prolyl oligopeptidase family serine peptidase [Dysgonomonas sp.]